MFIILKNDLIILFIEDLKYWKKTITQIVSNPKCKFYCLIERVINITSHEIIILFEVKLVGETLLNVGMQGFQE